METEVRNDLGTIHALVFVTLLGAGCQQTKPVDASSLWPVQADHSPAGIGQIAFVRGDGRRRALYVMNANGSSQRKLTDNVAGEDAEVVWSPNGRMIAYATETAYSSTPVVKLMNTDGTDCRTLTPSGSGPTWSPDGQSLAFQSYRGGNWDVYSIGVDGTNERNLTRHPRTDTYPAWSPDGREIAFHSTRDGESNQLSANWEIYVMNADGSNPRRLTHSPKLDWLPSWSPDGKTIAFWSTRDGTWEVYLMDRDGANQRRLTTNSGAAKGISRAAWSPDGHFIAFSSPTGKEGFEIRVVGVDTDYRARFALPGSNHSPAWCFSSSQEQGK